jgi:hypothetical protein
MNRISIIRLFGIILGIFILYYLPFQYFQRDPYIGELTTDRIIGRIFSMLLGLLLICPWRLISKSRRLWITMYSLLVLSSVVVVGLFTASFLWTFLLFAANMNKGIFTIICYIILFLQLIAINNIRLSSDK